MRKNRTTGIFAFIVLAALLLLVVGSRAHQNAGVVIDGGVQSTAQPTDTAVSQAPAVPVISAKPSVTLPDVDTASWELVLVNKNNPIKTTPKVKEIGKTGAYFASDASEALNEMISACKSAGYSPFINLAYVPYSAQEYYFSKKASEIAGSKTVTEDDETKASRIVARAGESEHQTGLAVDITDHFYTPYTSEDINSDMLAWLVEHCAEYGFIQRYPAGKENITGYREPYHFRYVGKDAAAFIADNDLCLEEFLAMYK